MSATRPDPVTLGAERDVLRSMLDWYRAGVVEKVAGLDHESANRVFVASGTTTAGLVKHLAGVEDHWWYQVWQGVEWPDPWASAPWDEDRDWEFHSAADDSLADLVSLYEGRCAEARRIEAAAPDLDTMAAAPSGRGEIVNLRWIMLHMIEETARHLGHLDILCELADSRTGE